MLERSGQSIYLMLCTIVDSKGRPMKEGAMLEGLAKRLEDILGHHGELFYVLIIIKMKK